MSFPDITARRLVNQQVTDSQVSSPQELLKEMGPMQAQHYQMVKWALGIRVPGATKDTIEQAIAEGTIIRTHLLRPTWHIVAAKDLRWMLKLTAPRIKVAMRTRHKALGLTDALIEKSNTIIADALANRQFLRRKTLVTKLEEAGFKNKDNRASHLLLRAELDGVICSGPSQGKHHTYALFEERVPQTEAISKEEALKRLADIYFSSHGPATLSDFKWWSGLTKTTARKALEMIKPNFTSTEIDATTYWFSQSQPNATPNNAAYLLPAFDEFLVSYKSRHRSIPKKENRKKAILNNGIFRPVIVMNGEVKGIWKRSANKDIVSIDAKYFEKPSAKLQDRVKGAARQYASFLGKEAEIKHDLL